MKAALRRFLFYTQRFVASRLWGPNRAISVETVRDFGEQSDAIRAPHLGSPPSHLNGELLAVDPAYQKYGYGLQLATWGALAAKEENVPIFGESTPKALAGYLKLGGQHIGTIRMPARLIGAEHNQDPIRLDVLDVPVLMWMP